VTPSITRVGAICNLINGRAFKPEDWSENGVPIIRIQNLNDASRGFNYWAGSLDRQIPIEPGDVLLAWSGTPGTSFGVHIWQGPAGILNQHIFRVDLDERKICRNWFMRAVNSRLYTLIAQAHGGVGLKHVTRRMVDDLEIPLPPLDEQRRIATILDQADDLRRKRREALERLKHFPSAALDELLDAGGTATEFRLDELIRLGDRINYGVVQPGPEVEQGIPLIRVENVVDEECALKRISPRIEAQYSRSRLRGDEILIACVGSIGAVTLAQSDQKDFNIARAVARIPIDQGRRIASSLRNI
jgi:type I restriction enzyme, S subunit